VGRAAERGAFDKNVKALERALGARYVVFDKTGTLTVGAPRVVEYVGDDLALSLAASAEAKSAHSIAAAVVKFAAERGWLWLSLRCTTPSPARGCMPG
jgi:P-type E1-E2 ATPase